MVAKDDDGGGGDLAPVPWTAVAAVAGAAVLLLLLVARRYGWHRDELYFLEAGREHLAWGYVDQPSFTPLVARLADAVAPGNLVVLRLAPALTSAATIVLGALLVRELGGDRTAQVAGAGAVAAGGFVLGVGHLLSTAAFDLTAWMAALWCTARLLRTGHPRWWLGFGAVVGVALLNKHLIVMLVIAVLVAMVVARRRELLRTSWLPAGGGLAVAIASPNLLWQAAHGWPQLEMAEALSERLAAENRATLLPLQLLFAGPVVVPILLVGASWMARSPSAARVRPLLWAWPVGIVLTFVTGGRPYYVLPLTTVLVLAGVVAFVERGWGRHLRWMLPVSLVTTVPLALPVLPPSAVEVTGTVNEALAEQVGWPELVDQVASVVQALPSDDREHVVLLTLTYGEAGAIDRFGPARGLPPAHSPHNGYWELRRPSDPDAVVVTVRYEHRPLAPHFERCELVDRVDNGHAVDNEVQGTPIHVCRGLRAPWPDVWDDLRRLS